MVSGPRRGRSGDPIPWRGLLLLRTAVIVGVGLGSGAARFAYGESVPLGWLLGLVGVWAASQVLASRSTTTPGAPALSGLMALDIAAMALVFHWTGGPMNPFTFLTLIYLALAAVVLPPAWAWSVGLWAAAAFGLLFLLPPTEGAAMTHAHAHHAPPQGPDPMAMHLRGMWVGYVMAGAAILGFVGHIARALSERDHELAQARETAERSARLASLATLAAGAAHELGTPLGTIAIAARELERTLERQDVPGRPLDDARLIVEEVARCRSVLGRLRTDAGDPGGEAPADTPPADLVAAAVEHLGDRVQVEIAPSAPPQITLFPHTSADALRDVVRNALEAAPAPAPVRVLVEGDPVGLRIVVQDEGPGMDPETLARATEPFFTTRPAGQGMGLGLFLARTVVERTGGHLHLDSQPGHGTTVTLTFAPVT